MNTLEELVVAALRACEDLPPEARARAAEVRFVAQHSFGAEYLDFLDDMVAREAQGAERNELLLRRRNDLAPFIGQALVRGVLWAADSVFAVEVDPKSGRVIHWEQNPGVPEPPP